MGCWRVWESNRVPPSYIVPQCLWYDIPQDDKNKILELRRQNGSNRQNHGGGSVVSEVTQGTTFINGQQYTLVPTASVQQSHVSQVGTQASPLPPPHPTAPPLPPPTQVTFMGGRNEQASLRSRNGNTNWGS